MSKVPIVIINWNGIHDTIECITAVLNLNHDNYQIHLIDNGSDIDNAETLQNLYGHIDNISLHLYETNLGFTKAHIKWYDEHIRENKSIKYITLLNNDTEVDPNWLSALIKCAEENNAAVISSKMVNYYNRSLMDNAGHKMLNTGEIIPIGHGEGVDNFTNTFENIGACGGACLYSRAMIEDIGFFDPYFSTGYEDAELGLRAKVAGYKLVYSPDAVVFHKMGQSIKKIFNEEYTLMIHTSILYSYYKNMPILNILLGLPSIIFKFLAMLIVDVLFLRLNYLRILLKSWKNTLQQTKAITTSRKDSSKLKRIKFLFFRPKVYIYFLFFDLKRFLNLIVLRQDSAIDKY